PPARTWTGGARSGASPGGRGAPVGAVSRRRHRGSMEASRLGYLDPTDRHFAGLSAVFRLYTSAVVSSSETASRLPVRSKARWGPRRGSSIRPTSFPSAFHIQTRLGPCQTFDTTASREPSWLYASRGQLPSAVAVHRGLPEASSQTVTGYSFSTECRVR